MVAAPVLQQPQPRLYTFEEYLECEDKAESRSEYRDGRIVAMAGGSLDHGTIGGNTAMALNIALRTGPCRVATSDVKVRLTRSRTCYPDVSVVCERPEFDPGRADVLRNPVLVGEVLSNSTEAYDRGEKFFFYRQLPSVQEVVFISQSQPLVEVCTRQSDDTWRLTEAFGLDASVTLHSLGVELFLRDLYSKVELPPAPDPPAGGDAQP